MGTVDIFITCEIDQLRPTIGLGMISILEKLNLRVNIPKNQLCCGKTAFVSGCWDDAKKLGERFIKAYPDNRKIICPSASCVSFVKKHYSELFLNTALHNEFKLIQRNLHDLTDFMVNVQSVSDMNVNFNYKLAYYESCKAREYGLKNEPITLLKNIKGAEFIDLNQDECCGSGGMLNFIHPDITESMTYFKLNEAIKKNVEYIVTTESSCLINLDNYIKKNNLKIKAVHIAEILGEQIK
ncbi:MAG: hypothetical protein A2X12_02930 [Bacteroidetes bacterium GWE2_29_8]|nr:MAG: hypothetical protein A2X12_02930 [Bacteroidetes bacterium GWE2_29_8]OFY24496.1 MAG: hypothetical protein A2X02_01770 [Bacteroidetes bacterium GWF2_29_10]